MSTARIVELVARSGGDVAAPVEPLAGGDISRVVRCGDRVVKLLAGAPTDFFATEARGLRQLGRAGVSAPEVLHVASDGLVLRWLPPGRPDPGALGSLIARLHAPVPEPYGSASRIFLGRVPLPAGRSEQWTAHMVERRLRPLVVRAQASCGPALTRRLHRWLDDVCFPVEGPAWVHGDLWSGNVVDARGGPVFIDPSVQVAERGLDLAMMRLFGGFSESVWQAIDRERPIPQAVEAALPGYALYFLLAHVVMFGRGWCAQVRDTLDRATSR